MEVRLLPPEQSHSLPRNPDVRRRCLAAIDAAEDSMRRLWPNSKERTDRSLGDGTLGVLEAVGVGQRSGYDWKHIARPWVATGTVARRR